MNITPTTFKARFPEFSTTSDAVVQMHLNEAEEMLDEARWANLYDIGCGYYVANNLQMAKIAAAAALATPTVVAGGFVTSVKVGDVAYTVAPTTDSAGASTAPVGPYGLKYKELARLVGKGAVAL